ncbi:hypothetical protein lerEdw1_011426 [Lerista edwardsae]|nr:hypothetical protein lerEdw1_011426 [Lerista edwardsae]
MASSMAEDLVCSVCLSLFQEPHMLRCGHNFCLSCLESCVPGSSRSSTGKCPECRHPFSRQDFTCNRALANLAKKARRLRLDEEPLPTAAMVGLCEEHDEPLKLFCQQDLVPICVICRDLPQHRGHDFLPTKNAVKYAKEILEPYQVLLKFSLWVTPKRQMKEMEKLETCTEEILSHICKEFEVLHQILHEKEQDFKKTVGEMKAKNLQEMEENLHSLKEKVSSHTEINAAFETADHFAFLKGFKQLMDRVSHEFQPWKAKDDGDASASEEESDEEEVKSNKKRCGYVDKGDAGDGEVSKEEEGEDSGDGVDSEEEDLEISEEEEEDVGDEEASKEEEDSGDGEVSEEEDKDSGDGEVSEEEDKDSGDGEVSEEEDKDSGDGEVSEEEDKDSGDGEVSDKDEEEEEDARSYGTTVVPLCSALKTFKDTLDFQAWKEMLERIQPRTFTKPLQ